MRSAIRLLGMLLVKHSTCSAYESFHCIATSTLIVDPLGAVLFAGRVEDVRMQHRLGAVDVLDETLDAAGKRKIVFLAGALVDQANLDAVVQERQLAQALGQDFVMELDRAENFLVGEKWTSVPRFSVSPIIRSGDTSTPFWISIRRSTARPRLNSSPVFLPSRRIVSRNHFDKALTQDTPTPCRPPDTLYEFWLNLPPACNTHITISAAERFGSCLSSNFTPVGMPRPLSVTEIELSA